MGRRNVQGYATSTPHSAQTTRMGYGTAIHTYIYERIATLLCCRYCMRASQSMFICMSVVEYCTLMTDPDLHHILKCCPRRKVYGIKGHII